MLSAGVNKALGTSGRPDTAIILRNGSDSELASGVQNDALALVRERPEVAKLGNGNPAVVGEIVIVVTAEVDDGSGGISNVLVRGSEPDGLLMRLHPDSGNSLIYPAEPRAGLAKGKAGVAASRHLTQ